MAGGQPKHSVATAAPGLAFYSLLQTFLAAETPVNHLHNRVKKPTRTRVHPHNLVFDLH